MMTKDKTLKMALEALTYIYTETTADEDELIDQAITAIKEALAKPKEPEPVAMRMPKVGDKVICIEDDSLGKVEYLTAGGSPEIKFDDGSHGTYMLREFAELFRYATTPPQIEVGCAKCGANGNFALYCVTCAEKFIGGILKDNTSRQ